MEHPLTSTMEDYLELIFNLGKKSKVVRVRDIARGMDVKTPSVTSMLSTLSQKGMIDHEKYEYVELTEKGSEVAQEIARRHAIMLDFLTNILGIEPKVANEDACKMEHAVSSATLEKLLQFIQFMQVCPRIGPDWLQYFNEYCKGGSSKDECLERMKEFMEVYADKIQEIEGK